MDSRHTTAVPPAAWRPSLLPQAGAAPRPGQAEPVPLLAALRQDFPMHAGATAVDGLQSCLASLAALAFAGLGAALMLQWSPSDGALAAYASEPMPMFPAVQAMPADAPAMAPPPTFMPSPAAARIERVAPPQAEALSPAAMPPDATLASAAITPTPPAHAVSPARTKAPAVPHAPRHAAATSRHDHKPATAAAARYTPTPAHPASTQAPQADNDATATPQADPDAALLEAVMDWHEQHAPPPASTR